MNSLNQLVKILDKYYVKLPSLPKGVNDFIVTIAPWLALIFGILAILSGLGAFGILSFLSPFAVVAGAGKYALTATLSSIILIAQGGVELMAFSPLKAKKVKGWNLLFFSLVLSVAASVVTFNVFSVLNSLIGALIGYYLLYQVKSYYK